MVLKPSFTATEGPCASLTSMAGILPAIFTVVLVLGVVFAAFVVLRANVVGCLVVCGLFNVFS